MHRVLLFSLLPQSPLSPRTPRPASQPLPCSSSYPPPTDQWRSAGYATRMSQHVFKISPRRSIMIALPPIFQRRALSAATPTTLHFFKNRQLEQSAARKTNKLSLRQLVSGAFRPLVLVLIDFSSGVLRPSDERGASHQGRGKFTCLLVFFLIAIR